MRAARPSRQRTRATSPRPRARVKLPVPPIDPILIRTATDPGAQPRVDAVMRPHGEPERAAHPLAEPPLTQNEGQLPPYMPGGRAPGGQTAVAPTQWTGPNGTMVLNNALRELVPPLVSHPVTPRTLPDFSEDSSGGSTTGQGPTLVYKPVRPSMASASPGPANAGEPEPLEQRPPAPPARTLRTIVYVLAAILFAVVGFFLMGLALQYLDMPK